MTILYKSLKILRCLFKNMSLFNDLMKLEKKWFYQKIKIARNLQFLFSILLDINWLCQSVEVKSKHITVRINFEHVGVKIVIMFSLQRQPICLCEFLGVSPRPPLFQCIANQNFLINPQQLALRRKKNIFFNALRPQQIREIETNMESTSQT